MTEGFGDTLHALGDVVEGIESAGGTVAGIETAAADGEGGLLTTLDVAFQLPGAGALDLAVDSASVADDGTLSIRLQATASDASVSADGGAVQPAPDPDAPGGEPPAERPAYTDPDRLREVYAAHDSFPAMTEALGVDVTPQTVRRHMIEAGIHEPEGPPAAERDSAPTDDVAADAGSGRTHGGDPDQEPAATDPPALADFEDVSLEDLTDAVRSARTIREVGQRLDVPRERAFRLLNTLGLIDLVSGRLRSADRHLSPEELEERIQRATAEE